MDSKNVNKILIIPYKDKEFLNEDKDAGAFSVPVNPESYTRTYKVEYDDRNGHGQAGSDPKYKASPPEELKLEFIFDSTGTIQGYHYNIGKKEDIEKGKAVDNQVKKFLKTVYDINGQVHRPRFLKLCWGTLHFPCVLTNVDINYTLFNKDGHPIRAKANATFKEYISPKKREQKARNSSPDLTHRRLIKAGDRLDNIVHDIYNDSQYVLQVAKVNGFSSFRTIPIGQELILPPLDKTEI